MYKETLPSNCPHIAAQEEEKYLYRIFKTGKIHEGEFVCYTKAFPELEKYKTQCSAYAISFFETRETAIAYSKKGLGNHIARILIKKDHGKLHLSSRKTGHYNLWVYDTFDCSQLQVEIETI